MINFSKRIGFIGLGRMGTALLESFLNGGFPASQASFIESDEQKAKLITQKLGVQSKGLDVLLNESNLIFLCVKPQQLPSVLTSMKPYLNPETCLVSIAAGVTIAQLQVIHESQPVIRVMPNTPIMVSEGVSAMVVSETVDKNTQSMVSTLLSSLGLVVHVKEEHLDGITGLSGSGPAYMYRVASIISDAVLSEGLESSLARQIAAQTLIGAGKMLLESDKSPDALISDVMSPNGTTEAGMMVFDESNIDSELSAVIKRAVARSKELSKEF